jgi:hypothetical protein
MNTFKASPHNELQSPIANNLSFQGLKMVAIKEPTNSWRIIFLDSLTKCHHWKLRRNKTILHENVKTMDVK